MRGENSPTRNDARQPVRPSLRELWGPGERARCFNDTLFIEATGTGASTDYSYTTTSTWNSAVFAQPSFQATPASGNLTGGSGSTGPQTAFYSYSITDGSGNSGYDPVGNVVNYSDSVMGTWTTTGGATSCNTNTNQNSGYDCLNRLTTLQNTATTATSTQYAGAYLCWSYDAFGNRTAQGLQTIPCASPQSSVPPTASYNANNQVTWTTVNAATNGFSYDAAGNVVNDNVNQYLYDAEGRVCAVANTSIPGMTTMAGYVYDGDGNRVAKGAITSWSCDPTVNGLVSAENETEYILGLDGRPVSEMAQDDNGEMQWQRSYVYAGGALIGTYYPSPNPAYNPANPAGQSPVLAALSFRVTDWLGTLRATTDASGVLQATCGGLPFGDQLSCQGNVADPHYFTGKERDAESGNDSFGARYYSSNMGRFLTPDWAAKPADVPYASFGDPQTLNLYAYVENGPLNRVDADGHAGQQNGTSTLPINMGGACASFSDPRPDCSTSFLTDAPEEAAAEARYAAQVQQSFASSGNRVAQQQSSSGGGGFWSHVGNLLHGHSWDYVQTTVTTTETYTVSEPNSHVDLATSAAGLLSATPGAVPGAPGLLLGLAAGGVSSVNDPSGLNLTINATGGALGVASYAAEGTAVGTGATVAGFGVAVGATAWSASNWISTNIITPVFTPDANQSNTINANGVTIQAPDAFDWSQP